MLVTGINITCKLRDRFTNLNFMYFSCFYICLVIESICWRQLRSRIHLNFQLNLNLPSVPHHCALIGRGNVVGLFYHCVTQTRINIKCTLWNHFTNLNFMYFLCSCSWIYLFPSIWVPHSFEFSAKFESTVNTTSSRFYWTRQVVGAVPTAGHPATPTSHGL